MEKGIFIKPTKYFGNVEVKFTDIPNFDNIYASFWAVFNCQNILVSIFDYDIIGDKLALCWSIVDKYPEINKIAKKAMVKNFYEKESKVNEYFKYYFEKMAINEILIKKVFGVNDFERININNLIEQLNYPNLDFYFEDNILTFSVDYAFLENYFDDDVRLYVTFNEEQKVIDFEIEYES